MLSIIVRAELTKPCLAFGPPINWGDGSNAGWGFQRGFLAHVPAERVVAAIFGPTCACSPMRARGLFEVPVIIGE